MQRSDNEVLSKKKIISEKTDLVIQDVARSSTRHRASLARCLATP